jgi:hypothetical protein
MHDYYAVLGTTDYRFSAGYTKGNTDCIIGIT